MRGFFYEVIYRQKITKVTKKQIKKENKQDKHCNF